MDVSSMSLDMLFSRFMWEFGCVYGHIVHIDQQPSFSYFLMEDSIHHSLEHGWGICESKEHHCGFEQSFQG